MGAKLDIKVEIAGRKYSMKGIDSDREEVIRRAAKAIDSRVSSYQSRKLVDDPVDYLAMAALQVSIENETQKMSDEMPEVKHRLEGLESMLESYLKERE